MVMVIEESLFTFTESLKVSDTIVERRVTTETSAPSL